MNPEIEVRLKALEVMLKGECDRAKKHLAAGLLHSSFNLTQLESILAEVSSILKLFNPPAPAPKPTPAKPATA